MRHPKSDLTDADLQKIITQLAEAFPALTWLWGSNGILKGVFDYPEFGFVLTFSRSGGRFLAVFDDGDPMGADTIPELIFLVQQVQRRAFAKILVSHQILVGADETVKACHAFARCATCKHMENCPQVKLGMARGPCNGPGGEA